MALASRSGEATDARHDGAPLSPDPVQRTHRLASNESVQVIKERTMNLPAPHLLNRVRGEFLEMPGLRLRVDQAQRLWNLDRVRCEELLFSLVEEKFLCRYADQAYGLPSTL